MLATKTVVHVADLAADPAYIEQRDPAIGTVSNVASRLCDEAKPGQILISPRVLTKVENAVTVEAVGEFELKGIRRPLAAYNVVGASRTSGN
jgi:class 3 adenylate cyclase